MSEIEEQIEVRLEWEPGTDLPTVYANQLYISHAGGEFYLVFGEIALPILTDFTREALGDTIPVKPVAKLAIAPEAMFRFVEAINSNIKKYTEKYEQGREEE